SPHVQIFRNIFEQLSLLAIEAALGRCHLKTTSHIHFVTHSLGGILVRVYLEQTTLPKLGRVVMLAPPNQGSHLVDKLGNLPGFAVINGRAATQLGTGPHHLPAQLGPVTYPVGIIAGTHSVNFFLSLFLPGANDGRVTTENTKVAGMTDYIEVPASHPFIMRHSSAIQQAVAFIQTGAFRKF
ncbi:MAG: esterase/lipase family protein, partial [Anaerolineae bacterium]